MRAGIKRSGELHYERFSLFLDLKSKILYLLASAYILFFTGCIPIVCKFPPSDDLPYRISIKNNSNADISVKIVVGEIPAKDAKFADFKPFTDDIFQFSGTDHLFVPKGFNTPPSGRLKSIKPLSATTSGEQHTSP